MQLLGSSFPKERLLTTDPAIRVWWACHSKPPLPCNGTLGVWWVVGAHRGWWQSGKNAGLGEACSTPRSSPPCCVISESHVTSLNMPFLVYKTPV